MLSTVKWYEKRSFWTGHLFTDHMFTVLLTLCQAQ